MFRTLRVEFDSLEIFQAEYQRNIANGGVFASTYENFELREVIDVTLSLGFCDRTFELQGEVVSKWPHLAATAEPGIAIQFLEPIDEVRALFAELIGISPTPRDPEEAAWLERFGPTRRHERSNVSVPCTLDSDVGRAKGETRNLSRSGVLIAVESDEPPTLGEVASVQLTHPRTGEERQIPARIVRVGSQPPDRRTVALAFELPGSSEEDTAKFVQELCYVYGTSAADAITGPVQTIGAANLVQTFSSCTQCGTLTIYATDQRAAVASHVVFESGGLRHASSGNVTGMKAFARILAVRHGRFEFLPRIPSELPPFETIPIYGALLEAVQHVDELARINRAGIPPTSRLHRTDEAAPGDGTKLDAKVLECAERGLRIEELVDTIDDFDAEVLRALLEARDNGLVEIVPQAS